MSVLSSRYREFRLDNGLFVALEDTPTQTIAAKLTINTGALSELPGEEGFAHFLEHCLMTGGSPNFTPEEALKTEHIFGFCNAGTGLTATHIEADMLSEHFELFMDFASGAAFRPTLDPETVEKERQAILREIADEKSSDWRESSPQYDTALFRDNFHTYEIAGKDRIIASAKREGLRAFHTREYCANNSHLVLVGCLPNNADQQISKFFGQAPVGVANKIELPLVPPLTQKTIIHTSNPDLINPENPEESSAHIRLGLIAPPKTHDDIHSIAAIVEILGDSGYRLHKSVRHENGLAYSIKTKYVGGRSYGLLTVYGDIKATSIDRALDLIFDEMRKLREEPIDRSEFDSCMRKAKYRVAKKLEANRGRLDIIEYQINFQRPYEWFIDGFEKLTPEKIMEAARKYLPANREDGNYVLLIRDPLKKS